MSDIKLLLIDHYRKGFLTSSMIDNDIKLIKKINNLFAKLEKTEKSIYIEEIKNILKILNNVIKIGEILMIFHDNVEPKYHEKLQQYIEEVLRNEIFIY